MIKVDIISGFLGAGKTTLIRKLLKAHESEKVVLIENEFGEIGIDGDLIEKDGFEVFEISSGCICCIMRQDFEDLLTRVINEFTPERIIIEPTGISILSEIIEVLKKDKFSSRCSINSLITVIDSLNYLEQCKVFGEFFEDQIINASTLLLSKSQFVDDGKITTITVSLKDYNPEAEILTTPWENLSTNDLMDLLAGNIVIDFASLFHAETKPCSENELDTFAVKTSKKFTEAEINEILNQLKDPKYGMVLRGKGFLKGTQNQLEFSYTNGQFELREIKDKSSGKLCLIGKNLNEQKLKDLFQVTKGGILSWLKF